MSPDELALGPETLVTRYAGARGGGVLELLAVLPGDLRKVPTSGRGGAGRFGIGEESTVERVRIGVQEPRRSRKAPVRAAVQEEEEQYQGDGGEGPNPAGMRLPRSDHLRRDHELELQGTGMPNLRGGLTNLVYGAVFRGNRGRG